MRKFLAVLILFLCSTSLIHGQKTRYGQDAEASKTVATNGTNNNFIKVHVSATRIRSFCGNCVDELFADALLNGKKIELAGPARNISGRSVLIIPGDYQARLTKNLHNADSTVVRQEFDLLLPDGTVWHCYTSGISE
ncbi:MAG: hypothetical protein ABSD72_13850 [Terracidiphilus sp.]|jgi:hypothetical protein